MSYLGLVTSDLAKSCVVACDGVEMLGRSVCQSEASGTLSTIPSSLVSIHGAPSIDQSASTGDTY